MSSSDAGTSSDHARLKVEFEKDLRTNALVAILGRPQEDKKGGQSHSTPHFCPFAVVLGVSGLQLLMAFATYCYVTNNMILVMRNPLLTSYEMFLGTNNTLPHGLVNQVCGDWEDLEIKTGSTGKLNKITMPDGSIYGPNEDYSLFYNLKSPFRTFDYNYLGLEGRSVLDNTLYIIHEGVSVNPFVGGAGYSLLFVLMSAMWLFAILVEVRSWLNNSSLVIHWQDSKDVAGGVDCAFVRSEDDEEKWRLVQLPARARFVLLVNIMTRFIVTSFLAGVGCFFIMYTTEKINLILNSLAVLFVLELDQIIFAATVSGSHQAFLEDLEPITIELEEGTFSYTSYKVSATLMPALPFVVNLTAAVMLRWWQVRIFHNYFNMAAAMCLFAGPTPEGETNLLNPVTGLCDSLLGASCAPSVFPNATLEKHGRCVITDQKVSTVGKTFYYLDDPRLFEGRVDEAGEAQSLSKWGEGLEEMYERGIWAHGPYQDMMRKNCLQMYQVTGFPEDRLVDDDVIETMPGAPFYCQREALWKALFWKFTEGKGAATDITMSNIDQVVDLEDPDVIAAVDECKNTPPVQPHPGYPYADTNALLQDKDRRHAHIKHKDRRHHKHSRSRMFEKADAAGELTPEKPEKRSSVTAGSPARTADPAPSKRRKKLGPAGILNIQKALVAASVEK